MPTDAISRTTAVAGCIGTIVACGVALVEGRPASVVIALIGIYAAIIAGCARTIRKHQSDRSRQAARIAWLFLAGLAVLTVVTFAASPLREALVYDVAGFSQDVPSVTISAVQVLESRRTFRIVVIADSHAQRTHVISEIGVGARYDHGISCYGAELERFRLRGRLQVAVRPAQAPAIRGAVGLATSPGFEQAVTGHMTDFCGDGSLGFRFPAAISLPSGQASTILIDVPKRFSVQGRPQDAYVNVALPSRDLAPSGYVAIELVMDDRRRLVRCYEAQRQWQEPNGGPSASCERLLSVAQLSRPQGR